MSQAAPAETSARLIDAATRQIAARGVHGVSIASVAQELGLTKQALLHHFGTKDGLYAAVLQGVADRLMAAIADAPDVVLALDSLHAHGMTHRDDVAILLRDLLDSDARPQAGPPWVFLPFQNRLIALARTARPNLSEGQALAELQMILGALHYSCVAGPTLHRIYGKKTRRDLDAALPKALRKSVKRRLGPKTG